MSEHRKPRLSLATQIFIGLGAGILAGIFFGDTVKFLSIVGDSFVSLLQMTVLPYIMVSLTAALGRLTYRQSAWTLLYPRYSVALPYPDIIAIPAAYAVPRSDQSMVAFLNDWLELKKRSGSIKTAYGYWIQGQQSPEQTQRWSVIRDVLHWVD